MNTEHQLMIFIEVLKQNIKTEKNINIILSIENKIIKYGLDDIYNYLTGKEIILFNKAKTIYYKQ